VALRRYMRLLPVPTNWFLRMIAAPGVSGAPARTSESLP
jgi:hypothetical protein